MLNAIIVGAGGFFGSALRYLVGAGVARLAGHHAFPWATLTVNVVGSFVIGVLGGYVLLRDILNEQARLFVMVGMLGGFTTFSTFSNETVQLIKSGQSAVAVTNILLHVGLCLTAAAWGYQLAK